MNAILVKHTGQETSKIEKDTERDFIMDVTQAKNYGIIDAIVYKRPVEQK
jgi:ATP-dependent Clp protease, protease subunit